ncbi:NlpC/P60 family protein [Paenibacillus sp. N3.4]|uniref:NlpC/P60 family protein n=1 Tax=Paenibacillus sp. N3.4 TaxID=2603222 RepID=UPI0011C93F03|nr:NlpC/P60 family protein [Paenibacillus sp. N3.4]TXK75853.1 peptidoglycan endopeptidase [Paenibacillus sp. N3.4]
MSRRLKVSLIGSVIVLLATITACGSNKISPNQSAPMPIPSAQSGNTSHSVTDSLTQDGGRIRAQGSEDTLVPIKMIGNVNYISADELIKTLKFQSEWDDTAQKLLIGDNDANFELTMNSTKARKDGHEIQVSQSFVKEADTTYIPVAALADLFQEDMSYSVKDGQLVIHASSLATIEHEDDPDPQGQAAELEFSDDPTDPFKNEGNVTNPASTYQINGSDLPVWSSFGQDKAMPVLKSTDINALISKGKQYLGVKYKFGAGPYPQTGRFDCSTFTQYVFGKYGVSLPRLAREQANIGALVSRKNLRKGDLMFYFVPGRFKSNKTVGHVGIYIGNMQMLHASPLPKNGVQITNIDKAYWKATFLRAKRVV